MSSVALSTALIALSFILNSTIFAEATPFKVFERQVTARQGNSIVTYNPYQHLTMQTATRLRVRATQGCQFKVTQLEIHYDESLTGVTHAVDPQGYVKLKKAGMKGFSFWLYNPRLFAQRCFVLLEGLADRGGGGGGGGGETPNYKIEDFILAANVPYKGGFVPNFSSPVAPSYPINYVWLRIPQFCKQLEVLELKWTDDETTHRAKLVDKDKNIYELDKKGVRISELQISLNGPREVSCDVPIYIHPNN